MRQLNQVLAFRLEREKTAGKKLNKVKKKPS